LHSVDLIAFENPREMINGHVSMSHDDAIPLGTAAMKALLAENRILKIAFEEEKGKLISDIGNCTLHIRMGERVLHVAPSSGDLSRQLYDGLELLSAIAAAPHFTYHTLSVRSVNDLSEAVKHKQEQLFELQKTVTQLSHETTELSLEQQRLSTARTQSLDAIASQRAACDRMILQKEALGDEVNDHKFAIESWNRKNAEFETALATVSEKLGTAHEQRKIQTQQLLDELQVMYTALDDAVRFLEAPDRV
jgi:hypothetical protein